MDKKTIGNFICVLRKANGMTQQELADRLHVSNKTVSRWERDESSPELSLIPVIAELFGVTSDELLRGERLSSADSESSAKSEKQISYLIKNSTDRYRMRSLLSAFLSVTGLILMIIFGFGLRAPLVGLGLCAVLIAASLILQLDSLCIVRLALGDARSRATNILSYLYHMWQIFFIVCYLNIFVLFSILPFIVRYQSIDSIMPRNDWLSLLPIFLVFALLVCLVFSFFAPKIISYQDKLGDAYLAAERQNARFRLICTGICIAALGICSIIQSNIPANINDIAQGKTFTSFEEFKKYAETPVSVDYYGYTTEIYDEKTGETRYYEESDKHLWRDTDLIDAGGKRYSFIWRNMDACQFDYNDNLSRITVYSRADQIAYNHYIQRRTALFIFSNAAIIAFAVIFYLRKRIRIGDMLKRIA